MTIFRSIQFLVARNTTKKIYITKKKTSKFLNNSVIVYCVQLAIFIFLSGPNMLKEIEKKMFPQLLYILHQFIRHNV